MHDLRLKNAGLRFDQTKLQQKVATLSTDNRQLHSKVLDLEKKNAADCTLVLNQCKELEHLTDAKKLLKAQVKKLQAQLKEARSLFKKSLSVKSDYEQIIVNLHKNPDTHQLTQSIINEVTQEKDNKTVGAHKTRGGKMRQQESHLTIASKFGYPRGSIRS